MNFVRTCTLALGAAGMALSLQAFAQQTDKLSGHDQTFLENAIQGSYAEIEGSQTALEKSSSADVKDFAQKMITDHGAMVKEATALASKKQYTPPEGPSIVQKGELASLKALSGGAFDAMYVNRIGVAAHEATVDQFAKAQQEAQDADIKTMIEKTLPKLREHLEMARALDKKQEAK